MQTNYLELFFRNLLMGEHNELKNRYLLVNPPEEWKEPISTLQEQDKHRTSTEQVPNKSKDLLHTQNPDILRLIAAIGNQQMSVAQMLDALGLKHRPTFLENYLNPAIADGYVRLLYPQSPRHPRQRYLLTAKGVALYQEIR